MGHDREQSFVTERNGKFYVRLAAILFLVGLTGACAAPRSYRASNAQTDLIGQNKNTIYGCAGVPNRTAVVNGIEYLTYENSSFVQQGVQLPLVGGGINNLTSQYCVATFALMDEKVVWLGYSGNKGPFYASNAQCEYIVGSCREMVKAQKKSGGRR